jgi:hypothetical protein
VIVLDHLSETQKRAYILALLQIERQALSRLHISHYGATNRRFVVNAGYAANR